MSLLDGLKDSMKNPLAENNSDMEFVLESDFELALEKATDIKLSAEDIRAILNGDDDIDDDEDDLDNPDDDVDKDYTSELEACKEALEATIAEIGIDDAADIFDEDDDLDDLELDPEGDDEILSEEALIAEIEGISTDSEEDRLIAQCEALLGKADPPLDDSAMESPDYYGADKNTRVRGIIESSDEDEDDDEEEEMKRHHHDHEEHESEEEEEREHETHEDDDDDEEGEDKHDYHHHHHHDDDDDCESEDDEKEFEDEEDAEEATLESILDSLLGIPM